jgi:hypothetical protein
MCPRAALQPLQMEPRTLPVEWQWSIRTSLADLNSLPQHSHAGAARISRALAGVSPSGGAWPRSLAFDLALSTAL